MSAIHHIMASSPVSSGFRYLAIKFIANRGLYSMGVNNNRETNIQLSILDICNTDETDVFYIKEDSTLELHCAYKGTHFVSYPLRTIKELKQSQALGRIFDNKLYTKLCRKVTNCAELSNGVRPGFFNVNDKAHQDVLGFGLNTEYGDTFAVGGWKNEEEQTKALLGSGHFNPFAVVIDLGRDNVLDINRFGAWRFFNADDNNWQSHRTWVWGEILGSNDKRKWWLLDSFEDEGITNANQTMARFGILSVKGKGDLIGNLDLSKWHS